jgi:hypothetical protein
MIPRAGGAILEIRSVLATRLRRQHNADAKYAVPASKNRRLELSCDEGLTLCVFSLDLHQGKPVGIRNSQVPWGKASLARIR